MIRNLSLLVLLSGLAMADVEKRVQFPAGSSGTTIQGSYRPPSGRHFESRDRYLLGAGKGQTMKVWLESTKPAILYIWQGDYNQGHLADGTGTKSSCTVKLPVKGDYVVDVQPLEGDTPFDYTLKLEIR